MKIVNTYQQTFITGTNATYAWDWTISRYMKSKPSNRFIVRISNASVSSSSTITTPLMIYMYHPNFCGGVDTQVYTSATAVTRYNKILVTPYYTTANNTNTNNKLVILCDEMPLTPINLNVEYSGTGLAPDGNVYINIVLAIYEIEGDIDITNIFI